jgi:diguanylate cyclase (GGDEF)-like protein
MLRAVKNHLALQKTASSLEYSLNHDILTKQYNRFAFEKDLKKINTPHLLILNINGFKKINDVYGNEVGNSLLKQLSELINTLTSEVNNIQTYRIGGDEFGFLFDNINSNYALKFAYLLEEKIAQHTFQVDLLNLNITVSIASNNIAPIFENADLALKEVKKDSTINVIKYKDSLNLKQSIEENLHIIDIIKKAIKHDRIVPYFQPIVNLETSTIDKYECLVRLIQDNGEVLAPFKFLDISKKTPYYHDITRIMIEKAIKTAKEYPLYRFSINISMIDILDQEIVDILFSSLDKDLNVSSRIDIELLESENLEHIAQVQNFITRLHSYGSKILIDDFGSGYSNFSYFADLDVDIVKIDGSITSEITTNDRQLHMLKSIYQFSKGMDLVNVAEFVESREIALKLKEIGITYAQGYYFSKPIPRPLESNIVTI